MAKGQASSRRSDILRAAEKLMATKGLNAVTTRQISKEVGCSEGALYVHFKGRLELLLAMLEECLPDARQSLHKLEGSPGRSSPQENLVMALTGLYRFHQRVVPLFAGLFAEPKLLAAYRKSLIAHNKGPHLAIAALEQYVEAEQKMQRIDKHIDAHLTAHILLSSCFLRAFVEHFFAKSMQPPWNKFVEDLVAQTTHAARLRA
jgi:AcrR family transcriptional regulator